MEQEKKQKGEWFKKISNRGKEKFVTVGYKQRKVEDI